MTLPHDRTHRANCMARKPIKWTQAMIDFLTEHYPLKGKMWCADAMGLKEHQIRTKASALKLSARGKSEAWFEERKRHSERLTGRKRPEQAAVMKKAIHEKGLHIQNRDAISKSRKEWYKTNPHPKGMLGKKHTEKTKQIFSMRSKQTWENYSEEQIRNKIDKQIRTQHERGSFSKRQKTTWKCGEREIGNKIFFFRSSWEANYARYLELKKTFGEILDWQFEGKRFFGENQWKGTCYLPDFEVTLTDGCVEFHEVKGWMDDRSLKKIQMMRDCYPDLKLVVIGSKEYTLIRNRYQALIHDWEQT